MKKGVKLAGERMDLISYASTKISFPLAVVVGAVIFSLITANKIGRLEQEIKLRDFKLEVKEEVTEMRGDIKVMSGKVDTLLENQEKLTELVYKDKESG